MTTTDKALSTAQAITNTTFERHFSIAELSLRWKYSRETIRQLVKDKPGVLRIRNARHKTMTRYSIPESIARRVQYTTVICDSICAKKIVSMPAAMLRVSLGASGTLAGAFRRKNTNGNVWEEAKAFAAGCERAGAWDVADGPISPPTSNQPKAATSESSITIQSSTDAYLANQAGQGIARSTFSKYKTLVKTISRVRTR